MTALNLLPSIATPASAKAHRAAERDEPVQTSRMARPLSLRKVYVFRTAPDSCRKRNVLALAN
jgi:hypothetical protein